MDLYGMNKYVTLLAISSEHRPTESEIAATMVAAFDTGTAQGYRPVEINVVGLESVGPKVTGDPLLEAYETDAPQPRSKPPHRAEPRPENPYTPKPKPILEGDLAGMMLLGYRRDPREDAWDEGFVTGRAAFDAVVAERDEMIRVSAANIAATQRNMDALRAHTLGAHDRPLCCGCDDDIETLAAMANAGDRLAEVVARVCGEGHPALAAWRAVSGSSEPPKEA